MSKIKLRARELRQNTSEQLLEMKKGMVFHLKKGWLRANRVPPQKNFDISEERKNIARINTILLEKEK